MVELKLQKGWLERSSTKMLAAAFCVEIFFVVMGLIQGFPMRAFTNLVNAAWCGMSVWLSIRLNRLIDAIIQAKDEDDKERIQKIKDLYNK